MTKSFVEVRKLGDTRDSETSQKNFLKNYFLFTPSMTWNPKFFQNFPKIEKVGDKIIINGIPIGDTPAKYQNSQSQNQKNHDHWCIISNRRTAK